MTDVRGSPAGTRRRAIVLWFAAAAGLATIRAQSSLGPAGPLENDPDFSGGRSEARPTFIFFPPLPPPLDRPVSHVAQALPPRLAPPPELAAYVDEPFYPPLSVRLSHRDLTDALRGRLSAYVAARATLREELETELARTREADPALRRQALETLARRQAARLATLEQTADKLRGDLITGDYDWGAFREWHLGEHGLRADSPLELAQVMRGYAFYQNGFSPAQRRLLREIALELAMAAESTAAATAAQPFLFFPPEPARVLLPDDLPGDLAAKVAAYQTKRSTLKKELFDAVSTEDGRSFAFIRSGRFRTLADQQAAGFVALESLAEDIRRGLALLPPAPHPGDRSPLPPILTARVTALVENRNALQKDATTRIEAVRHRGGVGITYSFDSSGLKFTVSPGRQFRGRPAPDAARMVEAAETDLTAIAADYDRRYVELINETDDVRRAIGDTTGNTTPSVIDATLAATVRYAMLQTSEDANREYRTAVFDPGLSPEQRRLLMGSVMEHLDLPLNRGELQPSIRSASW